MSPTFPLFRTLVLLVLAVLGAVSPGLATAAPAVEGPRVLILHSYAPDFSWTRDLHAGILSVLDTPEVRARYRVEYLDAKHHDTPAYQARLLELFREKYRLTASPTSLPRLRAACFAMQSTMASEGRRSPSAAA